MTRIVAGEEAAVECVRSLFTSIVPTVAYVGTFGSAFAMKLITNYLVGVHTAAAAEAFLYARRLGLDPHRVVAAITPSAGGSTMFAVRGRMMAERRFPEGDMPSFVRYFDLLSEALRAVDQSGGPILDLTLQLFAERSKKVTVSKISPRSANRSIVSFSSVASWVVTP